MAGASQRSIWATAPSVGDLALNGGEIAADNWNPTLTRWGATDNDNDNDNDNNNNDNEPLTRWGPPEPASTSEAPKHKHSYRHNHFSIEHGTFSYSLDTTAAVSDKTHFDTRAAAAAAEWDDDEDDQKDITTADGAEDLQPALGWEDTVFAPQLNLKSPRILTDLSSIAENYGVAIGFKDGELRITADSQKELSDARRAFEIYPSGLAPLPAKAKARRIAKPDRPGVWGSPRHEYTSNDLYTPTGQK
ncbi:hypothetical protein HDU89_003377 [Geranomyces variabilis]|nr:hypothetical protein HDU89_003377 [Geranomyces variabilis]